MRIQTLLIGFLAMAAIIAVCESRGKNRSEDSASKEKKHQKRDKKIKWKDARKALAKKVKVKKNGKAVEREFFTEEMVETLQGAMNKLYKCEQGPANFDVAVEDTPFTVDEDVLPKLDQINDLLQDCEAKKSPNKNRFKRQITTKYDTLWPVDRSLKIVLSEHTLKDADFVAGYYRNFIADMNRKTCLNLEIVAEPPDNEPYILVITELDDDNAGCWTYGGMSPGVGASYVPEEHADKFAHPIFISDGCWSYYTVTHEFLHALGLYHEQARPDRENYIIVHWDNIEEANRPQYSDCSGWGCVAADNDYDPLSVMHYGRRAWAIDRNKPVISPKANMPWDNLMGAAVDLSFSDFWRLNRLYCPESCPGKSCGVGYANPNNCDECMCPDGVGEGSCDDPVPDFACGGLKTATSDWQRITFTDTLNEPKPNECKWVIQAPEGKKVELQTGSSSIIKVTSVVEPCIWAAFEVRTKDFQKPNNAYCGTDASEKTYVSESDRMMAIYRYNYANTEGTFVVWYRVVPEETTVAETQPPPTEPATVEQTEAAETEETDKVESVSEAGESETDVGESVTDAAGEPETDIGESDEELRADTEGNDDIDEEDDCGYWPYIPALEK